MGKGSHPNSLKNLEKGRKSRNKSGRPKGAKDKIQKNVKDEVVKVWQQLEEKHLGLYNTAQADPKWFFGTFVRALMPKILEAEVKGLIKVLQPEAIDKPDNAGIMDDK